MSATLGRPPAPGFVDAGALGFAAGAFGFSAVASAFGAASAGGVSAAPPCASAFRAAAKISATDIFLSAINTPLRRLSFPFWECPAGEAHIVCRGGANRNLRPMHRARCHWQSIAVQQVIESSGPARQGIVIFFTIFLTPVYSPEAQLSTAVFYFNFLCPDSVAHSRARKEQNIFANRI
jgi:hypothetical protein